MRDLLGPIAPEVDVDHGWRAVASRLPRERRHVRAVRAAGSVAVLAVVVGGAIVVSRAGDGAGDSVRTTPAEESARPLTAEPGVVVNLPAGWERAEQVLTPNLADPVELFAAGTFPLVANTASSGCAFVPVESLRRLGPSDAFVWLAWRREAHEPFAEGFPPMIDYRVEPDAEIEECVGRPLEATVNRHAFQQGGENFYLLIAIGPEASTETGADTIAVLTGMARGLETSPREYRRAGATVRYPPGWEVAGTLVGSPPGPLRPQQFLAVATFSLRPDEGPPFCLDTPSQAVYDLTAYDALIWVTEHPGPLSPPERPRREVYARLPTEPAVGCSSLDDTDVHTLTFDESGRRFTIYVMLGVHATRETKAEALDILNSLEFEPR